MNRLASASAVFGAVPFGVGSVVRSAVRSGLLWSALWGALWGALVGGFLLCTLPAAAQSPISPLFKEADLPLGVKLIAEHQCAACHVRRVGGDGSSIYRPRGKINTPGLLRGMVDYCSTELNLGLFPEEVTAVAAVLDRDHYRFAAPATPPPSKP